MPLGWRGRSGIAAPFRWLLSSAEAALSKDVTSGSVLRGVLASTKRPRPRHEDNLPPVVLSSASASDLTFRPDACMMLRKNLEMVVV